MERRLRAELDGQGYLRRSYFAVPGGFALATQVERFGPDGKSAPSDRRWVLDPAALLEWSDLFSLRRLVRALGTADPGRYRMIVFLLTTKGQTSSDNKVSISEASSWIDKGADTIPPAIADIALTPEHHLTVLVYEFARKSVESQADIVIPSRLDALVHLRAAGLLRGRI